MDKDEIIEKIKNEVAIKTLEKEIDFLIDDMLNQLKQENEILKEENLLLKLENTKLNNIIKKSPNKTLYFLNVKNKGLIN